MKKLGLVSLALFVFGIGVLGGCSSSSEDSESYLGWYSQTIDQKVLAGQGVNFDVVITTSAAQGSVELGGVAFSDSSAKFSFENVGFSVTSDTGSSTEVHCTGFARNDTTEDVDLWAVSANCFSQGTRLSRCELQTTP